MMTSEHSPPRQRGRVKMLTSADVARIWTEEARKAKKDAPQVKVSTVWSYLKESRSMVGSRPGRYADNPVPDPETRFARQYLWHPDQEQELRTWWNGRLGQAHGLTGRGKRKRKQDVK